MENDPVSGNSIPPGSSAEEVRDNVDAKLSTGEYVLPADVVRYLGVEKIENLVKKAQESLKMMLEAQEGLPFGEDELQIVEDGPAPTEEPAPAQEPVKMAAGGLVTAPVYNPLEETLPEWMKDEEANKATLGNSQVRGRDPGADPDRGLGGPVSGWSMTDMSKYAANINNPALGAIDGLISSLPGVGAFAVETKNRHTPAQALSRINEAEKTGIGFDGKPLTADDRKALSVARSQIENREARTAGLVSSFANAALSEAAPDSAVGKAISAVKGVASPVKEAVDAVRSPVKAIREAVTAPVREAVQRAVKGVKTSVKESLNTTQTKAQEAGEGQGAIGRRSESKNKNDNGKNDAGKSGGNKSGGGRKGTSFSRDKSDSKDGKK